MPLPLPLKLRLSLLLSKWRRALLGPHVTALLTEGANGRLLVPVTDLAVARKLAFHGSYDDAQLQTLFSFLTPKDQVLIVGGHIGALAIPLAKRTASVDVIEANPDNFRLLQDNRLLNGTANITLHAFAAGDEQGQIEFLKARHNSGGSKIAPKTARPEFTYDRPEHITVPMRPLDAVFPGRRFDLILMDIEGAEYRALKGMPQLLAGCRRLQIEILPNHIDHVAGVTRQQFLEVFSGAFAQAHILGTELTYDREQFHMLLEEIYRHAYMAGRDVIFTK